MFFIDTALEVLTLYILIVILHQMLSSYVTPSAKRYHTAEQTVLSYGMVHKLCRDERVKNGRVNLEI